MPGAIATELIGFGASHGQSEFHGAARQASNFGGRHRPRAIRYVIKQPADVNVHQIVVRATVQEF